MWAAIDGDYMAAESRRPAGYFASDPTEPDDPDRAAEDLAVWRAALHPARAP